MLTHLLCLIKKLALTYIDIFILIAFISLRIKGYIEGTDSINLIIELFLDLFLLLGFRQVLICCIQSVKTAYKKLLSINNSIKYTDKD